MIRPPNYWLPIIFKFTGKWFTCFLTRHFLIADHCISFYCIIRICYCKHGICLGLLLFFALFLFTWHVCTSEVDLQQQSVLSGCPRLATSRRPSSPPQWWRCRPPRRVWAPEWPGRTKNRNLFSNSSCQTILRRLLQPAGNTQLQKEI